MTARFLSTPSRATALLLLSTPPPSPVNGRLVFSSGVASVTKKRSTYTQGWQYRGGTSLAFSSVNGDQEQPSKDDDDQRNRQERQSLTPRTGWNHNTPAESSNFWQEGPETKDSDQTSDTAPKLRTGWLHNTEPATSTTTSDSNNNKNNDPKTPSSSNKARKRLELAMKQQGRNHRILYPPTIHSCGDGRTMVVTEHKIALPLRRTLTNKEPPPNTPSSSSSSRVDVYFTIVERIASQKDRDWFEGDFAKLSPTDRAVAYVQKAAMTNADNMVLYLQGGPGFGAPSPMVGLGFTKDGSWAAKALDTAPFQRIVLMDQRGTGKSTPITRQYLQHSFPDLFILDGAKETEDAKTRVQASVEEVTEYMSNFRADNIVFDAEEIRDALLLPSLDEDSDNKPRPWGCSLGQSFGGFCSMSYLSLVPHPPRIMLFTGGIAPMLTPVKDVYDMLWERVKERNLRYYEMYPGDKTVVKTIIRRLLDSPARLPSGGILTARRFLQLGLGLGSSPTAFASLHGLLSTAFLDKSESEPLTDLSKLEFSRAFLKQVEMDQSFDDHPFYFWLHESIYADGSFNSPTDWAAHRAYQDKVTESSDYDYTSTCDSSDDRPVLFFGEMVFPWMAEDYGELQGVGLSAVANALATESDWGKLYDADKIKFALESNRSRAAAAVYHEDMYVEFEACMKVAARGGPLGKCKCWVTNDYQHSGLRDAGAEIFSKLYGMATGSIRTPS